MLKMYLDYTLNGEKNTLVLRMEMLEKIVQQYNSQHKDDGGQIVINRYCSECSDPKVEFNSDQETPPKKRKLACKKEKRMPSTIWNMAKHNASSLYFSCATKFLDMAS